MGRQRVICFGGTSNSFSDLTAQAQSVVSMLIENIVELHDKNVYIYMYYMSIWAYSTYQAQEL